MVWSQFSIKIFGVHFGNSVLDNSNWDKISPSLTKKSHTYEEGGAPLIISFWHLLMNFEKPEKSDFWKNEKICWRYHHFTHVYQKPQLYEVKFLRYEVRQNCFVILGNFFPFYLTNTLKNENIINEKNPGDIINLHFQYTKNHDHLYYCSRDMVHDRCYCYFHFLL